MSNLTMPTMTYAALLPKLKENTVTSIAYSTNAKLLEYAIGVYYHGNLIAKLYEDGSVFISNAGWETPTTRTRINKILRSNNILWGVTQKDFVQYLACTAASDRWRGFYSAEFNKNGTLVRFNGYNAVTGK